METTRLKLFVIHFHFMFIPRQRYTNHGMSKEVHKIGPEKIIKFGGSLRVFPSFNNKRFIYSDYIIKKNKSLNTNPKCMCTAA